MEIVVHKRIVARHPELLETDIVHAWNNTQISALRVDSLNFLEYLRVGFDYKQKRLEMVGVQIEEGWLIYHAMTSPSKKTYLEIERLKRGIE